MSKKIPLLLFLASAAFSQNLTSAVVRERPVPGRSATGYGVNSPSAVAVDSADNLYFALPAWCQVWVTDSGGAVTQVIGTGTCGYSGDNGPAASAQLNRPEGIAVDRSGDLYIADTNNGRIRKVSRGVITTVAGNGSAGYNGDNISATSAALSHPRGIAVDDSGSLYIADAGNYRIRKVSGGIVSTVAGIGTPGYSGDNMSAASAQLIPAGVALDSSGNLYIADPANHRVRKVSRGIITTVAGNGAADYNGDDISATSASLNYPDSIAVDSSGSLYISDLYQLRIRKVSGGIITTVAGNGTAGFNGDNIGATSAALSYPRGVAVSNAGDLYIADNYNFRVRKVSGGIITTVAGNGKSGYQGSAPAPAGANRDISALVAPAELSPAVAPPPTLMIDTPMALMVVAGGTSIPVSGWAVDQLSAIGSVQIQVDGATVGNATYGSSRPDICSNYPGWVGCPNIGYIYSLSTVGLSIGTHVITVIATDTDSPVTDSASASVTVRVNPAFVSSTKVGVFRNGKAFLEDSNGNRTYDPGSDRFIDTFIPPGGAMAGDIGVSGDWTGDFRSKVGIYRPSTGQWWLDANNDGILDTGDLTYGFGGLPGDIPVVGDWSGLGKSCIGIYRSNGSVWLLDLNCNGVYDNAPTDAFFPFGGIAGDVPVVGAWTGGTTRVGVVRKYAPGGVPQGEPFFWVFDASNANAGTSAANHPPAANAFAFGGLPGDIFVTGDWLGTYTDRAGVYRGGLWLLDLTGAHTYDTFFGFGGLTTDVPITGRW